MISVQVENRGEFAQAMPAGEQAGGEIGKDHDAEQDVERFEIRWRAGTRSR